MLGKPCREKGELEGVQAPNPTLNFKPPTPPNLPLYQTPNIPTHRVQGEGLVSICG